MKKLLFSATIIAAMLLTAGGQEASAQSAQRGSVRTAVSQKPLPAKIALKNAQEQLQKMDANSARYADLKGKVEKLQQQAQLESQASRNEVQTKISDYQLILTELNARLSLLTPNSKEFIETEYAIKKANLTIINLENKLKTQ